MFWFCRYLEEPRMIAAFSGKQPGKHVVHIACGSTYSAAITADGALYTWGRGNYGRLGHGKVSLMMRCKTPNLTLRFILTSRNEPGVCLIVSDFLQALVRTRPRPCWWPLWRGWRFLMWPVAAETHRRLQSQRTVWA